MPEHTDNRSLTTGNCFSRGLQARYFRGLYVNCSSSPTNVIIAQRNGNQSP